MIIPPLKIQGKKTKLIPQIMEIADNILDNHPEIDTWVEPFLGSGVVAFNCPSRIERVIVNDINPHIIKFYRSVADGDVTRERIIDEFHQHSEILMKDGYDYYNKVKDEFNTSFGTMEFLFLTRTGFNGVMRFNGKGLWNVPFCKLNNRLSETVIHDLADSVSQMKELFERKEFIFNNRQFDEIICDSPETSIFYCDPPYYGLNVQYYKGWGEQDEIHLNEMLRDRVFIYSTWMNDGKRSNPMIERYWGDFNIDCESHKYNVANNASDRSKVIEAIIYRKENDKSLKGLW